MTDVAALGISVSSDDVVKGAADLDKFATSADRAAAQAAKVSSASSGLTSSAAKAAAAVANGSRAAQSFTGEVAKLKAMLDPTWGALQKYKDQVQLLRTAQAQGAITQKQYVDQLRLAKAEFQRLGMAASGSAAAVANSAGAMRANTGNIAAQFQDIGVTAAMGMSPLMIALQQGTQLSAVFAQSGASAFASIGAAIRQVLSPVALLSIGLVALIAYGVQLAMEFFKAGEESETLSKKLGKVQFATDAVGSAQSILGNVMDLTTGKITTQSTALIALARAQLLVAKVQSQVRAQEARDALRGVEEQRASRGAVFLRQLTNPFESRADTEAFRQSQRAPGASVVANFNRGADFFASLKKPTDDQKKLMGELANSTVKNLERMRAAGELSAEQFANLASSVANYAAETTQLGVWDDAQRLLDGDRSGGAAALLDPAKASTKRARGGKTEAEKMSDFLARARAEVEAEKVRGKAVALQAEAAAELEQRTKLLNQAQQAGFKLTPKLTEEIGKLAEAYAKAKVDADVSIAVKASTDAIEEQSQAVDDQIALIGLYGDALARAKREQDAQARLAAAMPEGGIAVTGNLTGKLSDKQEAADRLARAEALRREGELSAATMEREAGAIRLTGAALLEYNFASEKFLAAKRAGITLSGEEIVAINAAAAAYAAQRESVDQLAASYSAAREIVGGFFSSFFSKVKEGGNVFKAFANSVVSSLQRILDKMLDQGLNSLFNSMGSSGGGFMGALASVLGSIKFAKGGAFGTAERFAKGGAFTNSVVDKPTLFRFANGGALGEMGEAGPEAIMPLTRGPDGKLGVQSHGGGGGGNGPTEVVLIVRAEPGKMFVPTVEAIADERAVKVVTTGIEQYNDQLPERVQEISNDPRAR